MGLAIGHSMEPLEDLLEAARAAERHAKRTSEKSGDPPGAKDRDALAVHWQSRGDEAVKLRASCDEDLDGRLKELAGWLENGWLSSNAAYNLRDLAAHYAGWEKEKQAEMEEALRVEALHTLSHMIPQEQSEAVRKKLDEFVKVRGSKGCATWKCR